jgi:hypothetical protein
MQQHGLASVVTTSIRLLTCSRRSSWLRQLLWQCMCSVCRERCKGGDVATSQPGGVEKWVGVSFQAESTCLREL